MTRIPTVTELEADQGDRPSLPTAPFQTLTVEAHHAGARLDKFLVDRVPELSRARVKAMIEGGQVRLDGRRARKGDAVAVGQTVDLLAPPPPRDFDPIADASITLSVLYEDADVIVVDKPSGMPTHPLQPSELGTAANAIIAKYPETAGVGFARREPGLLHRLDTDTSGVLVVARNQKAFDSLRNASHNAKVHKRYVALVEGSVPAEGRVDYPLVPHRKDPRRVEAVTPHVRLRAGTRTFDAHTRYKPTRSIRTKDAMFTLVEVEVETAFRHQVRVHLATVGHPLYADTLYKGPPPVGNVRLDRHFLHASEVAFAHPSDGRIVTVKSPLPNDLSAALAALEKS
jgi:23S rRNA pseudouridine1911/1915/1917 synthase